MLIPVDSTNKFSSLANVLDSFESVDTETLCHDP
ncbi:hypothetical protein F0726_00411 [Acidithiobacillus caldus]|jgi:hypothetical protein|nr:hypothetical protein F0726_00411 [Acidithiobacillus caldus]